MATRTVECTASTDDPDDPDDAGEVESASALQTEGWRSSERLASLATARRWAKTVDHLAVAASEDCSAPVSSARHVLFGAGRCQTTLGAR